MSRFFCLIIDICFTIHYKYYIIMSVYKKYVFINSRYFKFTVTTLISKLPKYTYKNNLASASLHLCISLYVPLFNVGIAN